MHKKAKFIILAIVILIAISMYFVSQREVEPPPATLNIDGKEQISGIGSYCWKETLRALCTDTIGVPTVQEPLVASSPFTAHIRLPVQGSPYDLYDLQLNIIRVKGEDELNFSGRGWRWWKEREEMILTPPLEHEQDIELSLEPGLYVLSIEAWWKDIGSASYGFLVEVQADGKPEVLKINPVIEYDPLEEYPDKSEGLFTVIKGSIPEVKENLKNIVIKKAAQASIFSADDELNFVVFRGVFSTGGYGINIDRVEKQGNIFIVYATYRDPGKGIGVTEAFTRPTAIIPIGKLAAGDYEARLRMTWVLDTVEGRDVIEPEKELSVYNFKIKPTAPDIGNSYWNISSAYSAGQAFNESAGNFTKKWDATNFAGFWRDPETNVSTETLVIDQSVLNNSHRIIEKHNLIYTTRSMPVMYQVYMHANQTPAGTDGFYPVMGWMGDKYVFLGGNKLAKIIFEQNATEVKSIRIGESWNLEGGYRIVANSIDADGIMQAWISLDKDTTKIDDKILATHYTELYSYPQNIERSNVPILVTYLSRIYSLPETDAADFKYTWLRSQNFTDVKEGDIFGVMEVTSVENGTIELRNKNPIDLSPGNTVHLMGNISIQMASSETGLLFYPTKGRI